MYFGGSGKVSSMQPRESLGISAFESMLASSDQKQTSLKEPSSECVWDTVLPQAPEEHSQNTEEIPQNNPSNETLSTDHLQESSNGSEHPDSAQEHNMGDKTRGQESTSKMNTTSEGQRQESTSKRSMEKEHSVEKDNKSTSKKKDRRSSSKRKEQKSISEGEKKTKDPECNFYMENMVFQVCIFCMSHT